jgi:NADPH:quinone reductase-like Zn-dependent oxidoreductase
VKKISYSQFGGPEVLDLVETAPPHPDAGQVRIAVRAAAVNAVDWRLRSGQFEKTATATHGATTLPAGVGQDAAGVVDEVGEGVDGIQLGDEVFGRGYDTYAEHAVLFAWRHKPAQLSFAEASGYVSVVETALRLLREIGVRTGQTLLVSGAAGGVGSALLQIARDRDIGVIGTAGPANQEHLRELGARPTTYGAGWVERVRRLGHIDAALDLAGAGVVPELIELTGSPEKVITIADLRAPEHGVRFSGVGSPMEPALTETVDLITRGALHLPVDKSYSLAEVRQAHADSEAGHTRGRRVIIVS